MDCKNQSIRVSNLIDWPLINIEVDNFPVGFAIEYINLLTKKVGLNINYVEAKSWSASLNMIRNREIDIIHSVSLTDERSDFLNFSEPYLYVPAVYYQRTGADPIENKDGFLNKSIGIVKHAVQNEVLIRNNEKLNFVAHDDVEEALIALSTGKVDVVVSSALTADYIITENAMFGIEAFHSDLLPTHSNVDYHHIGVRSDLPILMSIIEKGMAKITKEEFDRLYDKWIPANTPDDPMKLTRKEIRWLSKNSSVKVISDPKAAPFDFINIDGNFDGISGDYLSIISKKINLQFEWMKNKTWDDGEELIFQKKQISCRLYIIQMREEII